MKNRKTLVICFSTAGMDAEIWTNKQHLMSRLSERAGYEVLYIDRGMSIRVIKKEIKQGNWSYFYKPIWKYNDQMTCLSLYFLPLLRGGKIKQYSWELLQKILFVWINKKNYDQVIFWTYQPQSWYFLKDVNNGSATPYTILYDCVDDFKSQPAYENNSDRRDELINIEQSLIEKANYVTTTSKSLYKDKLRFNVATHLIHNVGDFEHFHEANGRLPDGLHFLREKKQPVITYAGVVDDYKIDLDLIDKVSEYDQYFYLFLGPVRVEKKEKILNRIASKNNVLFYGYVEYENLPSVLHQSDIIWLPYQYNEHTKYVFPLKLFEAFATGKKVVARLLPSYEDYKDLMLIFENEDDAIKAFKTEFDTERSNKRIKIAKKNSWENRLDKILKVLGE